MTQDLEKPNHIIADEGKVFQRISDGFIYGKELFLGMTYFIGGEKLDEPFMELPEHFIEIDEPVIEHLEEEVPDGIIR